MKHPFIVTSNLEIEKNGECFLNSKRITLLKLIKDRGSINAASKELKMSYQQAWSFIKEMNELSPMPLVIRKRGGVNGGGAEVTHFGERAIVEFDQLIKEHDEIKAKLSEKLWLCLF